MIPFYNYSIDCHKNMKIAYEQGVNDMRRKIYYELSKQANTQKDFELLIKIRNMKLNELSK